MATSENRFSSRVGLVLSVLGIAVGTGNIWRFPRIAAQNGGEHGAGAFLIAWVAFLVLWSLPLIIAEYAIGRAGRRGVIGSFVKVAGDVAAPVGAFVALVATAIMFYYSVVAGWCLYYLGHTALSELPATTAAATATWDDLHAGLGPLWLHAGALSLAAVVVTRGVASIERINRVLVPTLLVIVVICTVRALTLPGSGAGVAYLFTVQWDQLAEPTVWLEALTQNAWDTGAGWGLILTYAAYMRSTDGPVKNAVITGVTNNVVSLLAAVTIFGTVFAILGAELGRPQMLEVMRQSGPSSTGLTFIWMPQLFGRMAIGGPLAVLFFLGLTFAALSSLISMVELAVRVLVDFGLSRRRAIVAVFGAALVLGAPSALNPAVLSNQDFVWGVALMISGAGVAWVVIRAGVGPFRRDLIRTPGDWDPGRAWDVAIGAVVPVLAVVLLAWWLYRSAVEYAPDSWYDPTDPYSVASCLVQWGLAAGAVFALRHAMTRRLARMR